MKKVWRVACATLLLSIAARGAGAQVAPPSAVTGTVVEAASGQPLEGADVKLTALPPANGERRASILYAERNTRTDARGAYHFDDVAPGRYALHVHRLGYRPQTLTVDVQSASVPRVSVGLDLEPVELEPVRIDAVAAAEADASFARTAGADAEARLAAERMRQQLHLPSDVRVLTHGDVVEAVTLGEADLFRAMQRLPGVSTVDEYSAELWTRGASFDDLRIYVDEIPLFNPLHAIGAFGAVNPDAVGAALLHPGMQPANFEGGSAGTLELRTRRGADDEVDGVGEVSLASARVALDGARRDGGRAFMIAARRTYLDVLTRVLESVFDVKDAKMPYDFFDVAARYDWRLGAETALEASSLIQSDALTGSIPDITHNTRARWGSGIAQVTLLTPMLGRATHHTLGVSSFRSRVYLVEDEDTELNAPSGEPSRNVLSLVTLRGALDPAAANGWRAGYEVTAEGLSYEGPATRPSLKPRTPEDTTHIDGSNVRVALWSARRWDFGAVTIDGGLRIDGGTAALDTEAIRLAPRFAVRWQPVATTSFSLALARSWQYEQAIAASGPNAGLSNFTSARVWLVAGDSLPVMRNDMATVGVEQWLGERWLAGATAWVRSRTGVAHPDPVPGLDVDRPAFVVGSADAHGVDVSLRRLSGRWTAAFGYTYGVANASAVGLDFPADADQRHVVDVTSMMRLGRGWALSGAYTYASGAPYTRTFEGDETCVEDDCMWLEPPFREARNAQRRRASSSLDLSLDWSRQMRGWTLGGFIQVRNALDADNQGRYNEFENHCDNSCGIGPDGEPFGFEKRDEFYPGVPRIPLLGLRFQF